MSLNGKRDGFSREDIATFATSVDLTETQGLRILDQVTNVVSEWSKFAGDAGVPELMVEGVGQHLRLNLPKS